jgi:hypothetical protein
MGMEGSPHIQKSKMDDAVVIRFSPFAFRNFSIGGCPKSGQAREPAPTFVFSPFAFRNFSMHPPSERIVDFRAVVVVELSMG